MGVVVVSLAGEIKALSTSPSSEPHASKKKRPWGSMAMLRSFRF
jgi:hypothetical protein